MTDLRALDWNSLMEAVRDDWTEVGRMRKVNTVLTKAQLAPTSEERARYADHFLSLASRWRGPIARSIKFEIRRRIENGLTGDRNEVQTLQD